VLATRRAPTGARREASAARFSVVAAAPLVHDGDGAVPQCEYDLPAEREIGLRPIREEVPHVLTEQTHDRSHASIVILGRGLARWETRRVEDERGLRTASFALTAAGALLAAGGTTVTWTSTGLRQDLQGLLDLDYRGLDLAEGIAALVVSGMVLALLADVRRHNGRRGIRASGSLLAGVILVALPTWVAIRAEDRAVDEVAVVVARSAGITMEEAAARVRTDPDLAVRTDSSGVWLSIAGGVLVTLGGLTALVWSSRRRRPPDLEGDEP
jgi:hypothetical protein